MRSANDKGPTSQAMPPTISGKRKRKMVRKSRKPLANGNLGKNMMFSLLVQEPRSAQRQSLSMARAYFPRSPCLKRR